MLLTPFPSAVYHHVLTESFMAYGKDSQANLEMKECKRLLAPNKDQ